MSRATTSRRILWLMLAVVLTFLATSGTAQVDAISQPGSGARFPGDPGVGNLYFGLNTDGGDPAQREAEFGHRVGVYRSYWQASQVPELVATAARDLDAGRLPFVSTKLPGTWADVAAGKYDGWLADLMKRLGDLPGPVWLCLHHEPYDDQGPGQTPADYADMYRHAALFKPSNVALAPILQLAPFDPTVGGSADIRPWYALDAIDIVGVDTYNHWYEGGDNKWRDPSVMTEYWDTLDKLGKPIALAEYGVRSDPVDPLRAAQWMRDWQQLLVARGDTVAMSFFDSNQNVNDGGTPWTLDAGGNVERFDAFKNLLTAPGSFYLPSPAGP